MEISYKILKYTTKKNNTFDKNKYKVYQDKINMYKQIGGKKSIFKLPKFNVGNNVKWNYYGVEMLGTIISKSKNDKFKILTIDNTIVKVSEDLLNKLVPIKLQKFKIGDSVSWTIFNVEYTGIIIENLNENNSYKIMLGNGSTMKVPEIFLQSKKLNLFSKFTVGERVKFKLFNIEHFGKIISVSSDNLFYDVMKDDGLTINLNVNLLEKPILNTNISDQNILSINNLKPVSVNTNIFTKNINLPTIDVISPKISDSSPINPKNLPNLPNVDLKNNNIDPCHSIRKKYDYQLFFPGDKVFEICIKKKGRIRRLKDDSFERQQRKSGGEYYYEIDYDDGTFDTYVPQSNLDLL